MTKIEWTDETWKFVTGARCKAEAWGSKKTQE